MFEFAVFCDSKQEAVEFFTKNKVYISILNCHPGNKYKKCFSFVFKSFYYNFFTNFQKKTFDEGTEESHNLLSFKVFGGVSALLQTLFYR